MYMGFGKSKRFAGIALLLVCGSVAWAQTSAPDSGQKSQSQDSSAAKPSADRMPNLQPPRSDRVNINDMGDVEGQSSSKDTQIDLSPPPDDAKAHPKSGDALSDVEPAPGSSDVGELHPWDPHKAAKDIEVGDFYFKKKNYAAAESRYREALYYKDNDAIAIYRLGVCLDKMDRPDEARSQFESYLKILPNGSQAPEAKKAIERLKSADSDSKAAK
jgi:tetratricopeptide (TPR) repeat protein